jgi:hypothetical protein
MLAAAGSAIAYALNRAEGMLLSCSLIPWGIALLLWGLSFYCGCRFLNFIGATLVANVELLRIQRGEHPKTGTQPQLMSAASDGIRSAVEDNIERASRLGHLQFWFFIAGILSYVIWQLIVMYIATFVT